MREINRAGRQNLANGMRKVAKGSPASASRNDGLARWVRVIGLYAAFGFFAIGIAYFVTRHTQNERDRHQLAVEISRAEQKRQGRVVRAMTDGNCQMQQFDNKSGAVGSIVSMPCDTPLKETTSTTRDFNWGHR